MKTADSLKKTLMLGKTEGKRRGWQRCWEKLKAKEEDEIVGCHHQFNGHELGKTPGDGEGQRVLACCSPWSCKELDMVWLNNNNNQKAGLFKILKDDAIKMLHSICQQIWKTQKWPQDWKRSIFIPIPKKGKCQRMFKLSPSCTYFTC